MSAVELAQARERIQRAYSPRAVHQLGTRLAELLAGHLEQVEQGEGPVLNWRTPVENIEAARRTLKEGDSRSRESAARGPADLLQRFEELIRTALSRGQNLHHPGYIGHQVPASVPLAGLFDALGSVTNQVMAIYEMGPWSTAVEQALVERWGEQMGLVPETFSGLITHGGSLANFTALLTARNIRLGDSWEQGLSSSGPPPVLISHAEAHYAVARSAGMLGLGTKQVIRIPVDARRRMDANRLDETLTSLRKKGVPIVAVVSCACATPVGAFDPLPEIVDICRRHDVWLHVDAAHGGAVAFSRRHRHLLKGIEQADSLICDAHKMLFVPALCAFVYYREGQHRFEAFRQDAPYLFDPSAPGMAQYDSGLATVECTKRAAAYGLWGVWSMFGPQLFEDLVDVTFATTRSLYEKLQAAEDFEPLHEPECNIQAFRYLPPRREDLSLKQLGELNLAIRQRLIQTGRHYIVQTCPDGIGALRVSVMNPLTAEHHLDELLESIRSTAADIQNG